MSPDEPNQPQWLRDVEDILASAWPDEAERPDCAACFAESLSLLYVDVRAATYEAAPDDLPIGEVREAAQLTAGEFVGLVALQLAVARPDIAGSILRRAHERTRYSAEIFAGELAASLDQDQAAPDPP